MEKNKGDAGMSRDTGLSREVKRKPHIEGDI